MKKAIAPSILSADFARLGQEIEEVAAAGADWIHVDVMDGHFVPNITIGPLVVKAAREATDQPLDVHLMISPVDPYLEAFADAGADIITTNTFNATRVSQADYGTQALAREAGVPAHKVDPMGGRPGNDSYEKLMRGMLKVMSEALQ